MTTEMPAPVPVAKVNLLDLDRAGMEAFFESIGEKRYRAHQVMKWIYHRLVDDFSQMTDLGKVLRAKLEAHAEVAAVLDRRATDAGAAGDWVPCTIGRSCP